METQLVHCRTTSYFRILCLSGHLSQNQYKKRCGSWRKKIIFILSAILKRIGKTLYSERRVNIRADLGILSSHAFWSPCYLPALMHLHSNGFTLEWREPDCSARAECLVSLVMTHSDCINERLKQIVRFQISLHTAVLCVWALSIQEGGYTDIWEGVCVWTGNVDIIQEVKA